jgi:RNA polymerase sigma factor (sigma-70 family)
LQRALESLSPDHREVILLARVEGLSMKEIAERLHRSPNAVVQLLWRALKKLRDAFGETESLHLPPRRLSEKEGANER